MRLEYITFLSTLYSLSSALPFNISPLAVGTILGGSRAASSLSSSSSSSSSVYDYSGRSIPHPKLEINARPYIAVNQNGYDALDNALFGGEKEEKVKTNELNEISVCASLFSLFSLKS
jgi:hypothetical protein